MNKRNRRFFLLWQKGDILNLFGEIGRKVNLRARATMIGPLVQTSVAKGIAVCEHARKMVNAIAAEINGTLKSLRR